MKDPGISNVKIGDIKMSEQQMTPPSQKTVDFIR
jgi:hypothetical protein